MTDQEKSFIYWLLEGVTGDANMASDIRLKLKQGLLESEWKFSGKREYTTIFFFGDIKVGESFPFNGIKMIKIHIDTKYIYRKSNSFEFAVKDNGEVIGLENNLVVEKIR